MENNSLLVVNIPVTIQDLDVVCHVCGASFAGGHVVIRPASVAVMNGSQGLLERVFRIIAIDVRACVHIRSMLWLRIRLPLRHRPERCNVVLLPGLHNPPPVPSSMYGSSN